MSTEDQLGLAAELDASVVAAPEAVVARALLRGLVATHRPRWEERQCLPKFSRGGVPGCSLCGVYGVAVEVVSRPRLPGLVFHLHSAPVPECAGCGELWPCRVFETVRAAVVW